MRTDTKKITSQSTPIAIRRWDTNARGILARCVGPAPTGCKWPLALYCGQGLDLRVLDTERNPGAADVCEWVSAVSQSMHGEGVEGVAHAVGLALEPLPIPELRARRYRRSLLYFSGAEASWLRAFIARETARYALERFGVTATRSAIAEVLVTIRRASKRRAATSCAPAAEEPRTRAESSARLRLELS